MRVAMGDVSGKEKRNTHKMRTSPTVSLSGPFHSKDLRNATTQRISALLRCVGASFHSRNLRNATQIDSRAPPLATRFVDVLPRCLGSLVVRRERSFACATRAPRDTPALGDHGLRTALGCRCRGADCTTLSSILTTAAQVRGAGASEPDKHSVHAAVGCHGPAAAARHRGCGAEIRGRALPRCRAAVLCPAHVAGLRGHGTAAVVRCGTGLAERARCLPPLSGFSWAASPPSRA